MAEIEPRGILLLLKDVRYLYGQYLKFYNPNLPTSSEKLAQTLSSLKDGIYRFDTKYNTDNEPLSVFYQLTLGLSDTLIAIQRGLRSCVHEYGLDALDASEWPIEFDAASLERLQTRLGPILVGVDIINETMEIALNESFGIMSSESVEEIYKRIDEAENSPARLQKLVHDFIDGNTVQFKLETTDGRDLHTFTSSNVAHQEIGQRIAARLRQKTLEAVEDKEENEGQLAWRIRHSLYWLSKSSEDLTEWRIENGFAVNCHVMPASDRAWHVLARIFLDAFKAAWLLDDLDNLRAYEEPSFEIGEVVACAKKKILRVLQSFYKDIFTVPNYDLIIKLGDFGICTDDEREQEAQLSDSSILPY